MPAQSAVPHAAQVAIVGGGPAGLMAAEVLLAQGLRVDLYDAMPSVGRKFLLAGKGGLNLTHAEPRPGFDRRYRERTDAASSWLDRLDGDGIRRWAEGLGIGTFVGTSQRVFPTDMKAAPLLRAWLHRLRAQGLRLHARHRWLGLDEAGALRLASPLGEQRVTADAVLLALGGASWPQLGSDGSWVAELQRLGADIAPLQPANCGFDVRRPSGDGGIGWSEHLASRFAGAPLKNVALAWTGSDGQPQRRIGEAVVTPAGLEGGVVYAASADLRDTLARDGHADIHWDLLPGRDLASVEAECRHPRGSRSMSSHLQSRLKLTGVKAALLRECTPAGSYDDPARLAGFIKALPVRLAAARPVAEAISTAGGVRLECLTPDLMLRARPGLFCAGEMLDWEAPTGGYLLTACLSTGRIAGEGIARWLAARGAAAPA